MSKNKVIELKKPTENETADPLTELLRTGARKLIRQAVELELENYLADSNEVLADNKKRLVRNGYLPEREILTGIGAVSVKMPRIRDRGDGDKQAFKSSLIPPYMRRSATLNEVLPVLYLKGISERDFSEALAPIFGAGAKNLSPGVISNLKKSWEDECVQWRQRSLVGAHYVYWWVDGVGFTVRDDERRCVLVIVGVNTQGKKELVTLEDGFRESTESWLSVLRSLKARGLSAPALAVGDGALGFWNAVAQVYPSTKHQRCWFHKMGNVLDKLPKSQQARAKSMLHEIWMSATRQEAYTAFNAFIDDYGAKYPKATECLQKDKEELLMFYDFPAEHWVHLRTTNPIESTFATVRQRTHKVKGAFSSKTVLAMSFKLMQSAQKRWRTLCGFHHLDNLIKGVKFKDGKMQTIKSSSINGNNQQLQDAA
jgi:transposase-like protein